MLLLQRTILRMILFANVAKRLRYFLVPPPPFSDAVSGPACYWAVTCHMRHTICVFLHDMVQIYVE